MIERSLTRIPFDGAEKRTCKDCKRRWPWFQLKETPVDLILRSGGPPVVGPTPTLQEILYATGGREVILQNDYQASGNNIVEEFAQNTAAGTHDGSNLTLDTVHMADEPGIPGGDAGSGHMDVIYAMDTATFAGTISFVRWVFTAWQEDISAADRTRQISGLWVPAGFTQTGTIATTSLQTVFTPTELSVQSSINPLSGLPWTVADVNARKFGFQLDSFINGVGNGFAETMTHCSEFRVEIWGVA